MRIHLQDLKILFARRTPKILRPPIDAVRKGGETFMDTDLSWHCTGPVAMR
jgi:hypothetical protein